MPDAPAASAPPAAGFRAHALRCAERHGYRLDAAQLTACGELDRLYAELRGLEHNGRSLLRVFQRSEPVRGVYLWGGVGRGKSFLMDCFHDSLPMLRKRRLHFHRFMQSVHRRLRELQGEADPLRQIGREMAREVRLLCLDELHVSDIGDAMIMRNLLAALFEHGVALVTTSNQRPDELYEHGLQRAQFLPAIELIKRWMALVHVDGATDYRLAMLERAGVFHAPLGAEAEAALARTFEEVTGGPGVEGAFLEIAERRISARRLGEGVAWFEFAALCDGPRAQADYIELARRFHTVLVSGVPVFGAADGDRRRRFAWMVDEFYDRRVKLVLSAQAQPAALFARAGKAAEAQRTVSRLIEMQTRRYLSEPHLA
ncbi:MAG TPA: cell division protein ZapE [Burkholderiales bacterium]|nr:cell division protein ZapE [Burkholderiales bacterium]